MNVFLIWLGLMGVVGLLAAGCALCVWLERKLPVKRFDERQQEARGKGYRFGFWVGVAYYLILWAVWGFSDTVPDDIFVWILAGVLLQLMACQVYTLVTGAMLPFAQKPTIFSCIIYFVLGISWLLNGVSSGAYQQAQDSSGVIPWEELIFSVTFFSMGVIYFIDWLKRRRCDDGE